MLNYKVFGDGEPLLLIHGFGISFSIWENLLPELVKNHKVVVVELPGIGKSVYEINPNQNYYIHAASEIKSLRKSLQIKKWNVIAYSLGTRVAGELVKCDMDSINKTVLLYPAFLSKIKKYSLSKLEDISTRSVLVENIILNGAGLYLLIFKFGFNFRINKYIKLWHNEISTNSKKILKKTIFDIPKLPDYELTLHEKVSLMIIYGKNDLLISKVETNHRTVTVNGGHSGPISNHVEIIKNVRQFLS